MPALRSIPRSPRDLGRGLAAGRDRRPDRARSPFHGRLMFVDVRFSSALARKQDPMVGKIAAAAAAGLARMAGTMLVSERADRGDARAVDSRVRSLGRSQEQAVDRSCGCWTTLRECRRDASETSSSRGRAVMGERTTRRLGQWPGILLRSDTSLSPKSSETD